MGRGEGEQQVVAASARSTFSGPCPFCTEKKTIIAENDLALARWDSFPMSPGHVLITPKRHEQYFFNLTPEEQAAIWELLPVAKEQVEAEHEPDGYNFGLNDGPAGGQTIPHVHFHLIPRYFGDVEDPRGGIRHIIPEQARYWEK